MARLPEVCLLECLMPPAEYTLKCLVGSTYSLNPSVLLAMLVAATTPRLGDEAFALEERSKEEILHAVLEGTGKCVIFCDHHGAFEGNGRLSPHEKLVLNAVVKKEGRANNTCGSLHGKVLFALFADAKGGLRGRLYVGSKNFTETNYEEFGFVVDIEPVKSGQSDAFCSRLAGYLRYLRDWEALRVATSTKPNKLRPLETALGVLASRPFRCVVPNARFHWQGRLLDSGQTASWVALGETARQWMAERLPDSVYIHSPWVRKGAIDHLRDLCGDKAKFFLRCLDDRQLAIGQDPRVAYEFYHGRDGELEPYHSHAKVYLFKHQRDALLAFGSANFTPDGWGLSGARYRPNSEVLVTVEGPFAAFKSLAEIHGQPGIKRPAAPPTQDAVADALDYLSGLRADLDYDSELQEICYAFTLPEDDSGTVKRIEIRHDLVEEHEGRDQIIVWQDNRLPGEAPIRVHWEQNLLYLISPVMRVRDGGTGAEVHVVLDLDLRFFNGQSRLKCLSYTAAEYVASLARLMEVPLDGSPRGPVQGQGGHDIVGRFLHALRLERYMYRMGRLKRHAPAEFNATLTRVINLLRLKPQDPRLHASSWSDAIAAIEQCHQVLHEA